MTIVTLPYDIYAFIKQATHRTAQIIVPVAVLELAKKQEEGWAYVKAAKKNVNGAT